MLKRISTRTEANRRLLPRATPDSAHHQRYACHLLQRQTRHLKVGLHGLCGTGALLLIWWREHTDSWPIIAGGADPCARAAAPVRSPLRNTTSALTRRGLASCLTIARYIHSEYKSRTKRTCLSVAPVHRPHYGGSGGWGDLCPSIRTPASPAAMTPQPGSSVLRDDASPLRQAIG